MLRSSSKERLGGWVVVLGLLGLAAIACKLSSLPGAKMNMFEGKNALEGATRIKQKLGVDDLKIKYISIHEDRIEITIQDPAKPKNFDEYTYANGVLTGPNGRCGRCEFFLGQEFESGNELKIGRGKRTRGHDPEVVCHGVHGCLNLFSCNLEMNFRWFLLQSFIPKACA